MCLFHFYLFDFFSFIPSIFFLIYHISNCINLICLIFHLRSLPFLFDWCSLFNETRSNCETENDLCTVDVSCIIIIGHTPTCHTLARHQHANRVTDYVSILSSTVWLYFQGIYVSISMFFYPIALNYMLILTSSSLYLYYHCKSCPLLKLS